MARYVVGSVAALPPGTQTSIEVGRRRIAVFNVEGRYFALRDVCPHQGAPLSEGRVVVNMTADAPGCYHVDACRHRVRCPRHGWEYDLDTGRSWYNPAKDRVRSYPADVTPGTDLVPAPEGDEPRYVAETLPIRVEADYVVVYVN